MKLSTQIICDYLPDDLPVKVFGMEKRDLYLSGLALYETGCAMEESRLYVGKLESFPKKPPRRGLTIACIGQRAPQEWINGGCRVLLFSSVSLFRLFNALTQLFEQFQSWEHQLRDAFENHAGTDLCPILQVFSQLTHLTAWVLNSSLVLIFSSVVSTNGDGSTEITLSNEPSRIGLIESGKVKDVCRLERTITVPYISSINSDDAAGYYCCNLYSFGQFAGAITATSLSGELRKSDLQLCDVFFSYFRKAYNSYIQHSNHAELPAAAALSSLLDNIPISEDRLELFTLAANECWVSFKLNEKNSLTCYPPSYMYVTLSTLIPNHVFATLHNGVIVGVLRFNRENMNSRNQLLEEFQSLLDRMEYTAGLSDPFIDIEEFSYFLQQAHYAADQTVAAKKIRTISHFSDYALQYMLSQCVGAFPRELLYSEGLRQLLQHDVENQTDYIQTLRVYLEQEMNTSRTAEVLFLHRSSVLKRLARITSILDADLEDPDVRLHLRICLRLIEEVQL